jgi:hypothetical protein
VSSLYLIKRGPDYGAHWHPSLTPHRVIVCTARHTARWEAGWTGDRAWVWERSTSADGGQGWLIVRWEGLEIDYGHTVRGGKLPDGTSLGFSHPGNKDPQHRRPWELLRGAVWWSEHPLPTWLRVKWGVVQATDEYTLEDIRRDAGDCLLSESKRRRLAMRREGGRR